MKYLFKAINDINNSNLEEGAKQNIICSIRRQINEKQQSEYYVEPERLKEEIENYYRFRDASKVAKPFFRKLKGGCIINLNCGYYPKSIKKALQSGNRYDLKTKEDYYEIDDTYFLKYDYILFDNKCYLKRDYCIENGNIVDKTMLGNIEHGTSNCNIRESYLLDKKPINAYEFARQFEYNNTKFFIRINTHSNHSNSFLQNCIKYKGTPFVSKHSFHIYNRYYNAGNILIPVEEIKNAKFEVDKNIQDAVDKINKKVSNANLAEFLRIEEMFANIEVVSYKNNSKKTKILKKVLDKVGMIEFGEINKTLKMISDIMEVK